VLALQIAVYGLGLPVWFRGMHAACADTPLACQQQARLTTAELESLRAEGWSAVNYAVYMLVTRSLVKALCVSLAAVIFWRQPRSRMAFITSLFLLIGLESTIPEALARAEPAWWLPTRAAGYVAVVCFALFFYLFPNGQFVPGWTRLPAAVWALLLFPASPLDVNRLSPVFIIPFMILFLGSLVGAQVYRYRVVSNATARLQTKWVVFGAAVSLAFLLAIILVSTAWPDPWFTLRWVARDLVSQSAFVLIPASIAVAILRHHLWDIDVVIRRTLVYSVLSALLALVYFGSVLALQTLLRGVTGEETPLVIVLSTLLIAALAAPLRRRVQATIDRRFYRRKYDAARVLAAFGANLRDETDLGRLSERLALVVHETMQPQSVQLWLRPAAINPQLTTAAQGQEPRGPAQARR
jgi:hypothetical protein